MAALVAYNPTFIDLAKAIGPDGNIMAVIEILNATNELDDMTWMQGNLTDGHRSRVRTGLPAASWGAIYRGVVPTKGTSVQVTDRTGFLESLSEVDKRLVELAPNPQEFRFQEDRPHIEAMGQEFARVLFKGVPSDSDQFVGLEYRFNSLSAENGQNIMTNSIDEDTDVTSIWLIGWSPTTVSGIVPKSANVGLTMEDWGEDVTGDATNGYYKVLRSYWKWHCGITVPDWRYVVRAQVDVSELTTDGASGVVLPVLLRNMMAKLPTDAFSRTRLAFYMNRTVADRWATQTTFLTKNSTLMMQDVGGMSPRKKYVFDGIPINRMDVLSVDEVLVS